MPFKVRSGKYYCAYCYTNDNCFDLPINLRVHTQETHVLERLEGLEQILRPQFLNEILRVDVHMLRCVVCDTTLPTWNDMLVHINEIHHVQLDLAYTKLIPYLLKGPLIFCALCNEEFQGIQCLDSHMNLHYCNYMCSECGDTFVTEARLRHHMVSHNTGKHPCSICGKVFSLEKYKKKHEAMVHKEAKMFKCVSCSEAFYTELERHAHVLEHHKERVRVATCEICGKTFDWMPNFMAHMRKIHNKVKMKFKCEYCNKGFFSTYDLRLHVQRHTGEGAHICVICKKNFVTLAELRSHFKKHIKEFKNVDKEDLVKQLGANVIVLDGVGKKLTESES